MPARAPTGLNAGRPMKPGRVYPAIARVLYRRPALAHTNMLGVRLNHAARENA